MKTLKRIYSPLLNDIVRENVSSVNQPIFVFTGITPYIDRSMYQPYIDDPDTFDMEGNDAIFNNEWFVKIFGALNMPKEFHVLSHQQYAYIIEYLKADFFQSRVVIVYDNLRSLFPISKDNYVEQTTENGLEVRPESLPVYEAEQYKIGDNFFYSLKRFDERIKCVPLFSEKHAITDVPDNVRIEEVIDVISNPYAIDFFVNECLRKQDFRKRIAVKISRKNVLSNTVQQTLEALNHILSLYGGGVYTQEEDIIRKEYAPNEESLSLLKKYWGEQASFREINVYENPERNNFVVPVSQGLIVDTIIQEYKNGLEGMTPRDVFITAPTGAGKSLLFQLPAFYAASHGDMTIVVSPLKALMTDQVINLQRERHYSRVEFINSDLNLIDRDDIIGRCKNGEIDILYLSPELLLSYDIRFFIGERKLGLLVIDEAHLITTWGRDFRVDYWFLGNHINKIRKYSDYRFPLVALTATAVYGGLNDMVFDSISSLNMHDPHKFIGEVRRDNIEFVIDTHDDYTSGRYDENKLNETLSFIKGVSELGLKTIVYAPYTRQIDKLKEKADETEPDKVVAYHSGMGQDEKEFAYRCFRSNQKKIMIATKAFGMGVDIPDIQVVYHHAPSGLLPDYIQEIGRAARKKGMHGFAALTFSPADLRYSKQLFGMSSLKTFQLKEVLRKIIRYFENNDKKRNILIASSDFAYIFNGDDDVEQKVSTALMMIEKDYLIKTRFNVLIARPKKLFAKVYARTNQVGLQRLKEKYGDCFETIGVERIGGSQSIVLDLDKIWSEHFSDKSFPRIKNEFYRQVLLNDEGIELIPQVRIIQRIDLPYQDVLSELNSVLEAVRVSFAELRSEGKFFTGKEFCEHLRKMLSKRYDEEKIADFILATYSGRMVGNSLLEGDAFLQRRKSGTDELYRVFNTNYEAKFSQLINIFSKLFENNANQVAKRYVAIGDIPLKNQIRLGSLMEIMEIGSFETQGGDEPKLFIRINDPSRIKKDSMDGNYSNVILESVKNRHKSSCEIFEHFFTRGLSNESRWKLIEDFFLGASNDELFERYPGAVRNHVDILDYLKNNMKSCDDNFVDSPAGYEIIHNFKPRNGEFYYSDSMLTLENRTLKIKDWVKQEPILLHQAMVEYNLSIDKDYYKVLMSKIEHSHPLYFRDFKGLKLFIDFPGYDERVQASVPYTDDPVRFYKWWRKNQNKVTLSKKEEIELFLNVNRINPRALVKRHREIIEK